MGCDIHSIAQVKTKQGWKTIAVSPGGDSRNYDTFAVLADVRNGYGFAGTITGEEWPVMFEARGLPTDLELSQETDNHVDIPEELLDSSDDNSVWIGDHSHSYLNLSELEQIAKNFSNKKYKREGFISKEQAKALKKGELPESWCSFTNKEGSVYTEWEVPAIDTLWGLKEIIKDMNFLAKDYDVGPEDIRIVFGFDS